MNSVIVPLVKCKSGDLTDVNNYRAIAISTAISKIFEHIIYSHLIASADCERFQFGFKSGRSTSLCTSVFKRVTEHYYINRGSHVFVCFIDFSKAFDKVNYWKLLNKLLDDNIDGNISHTGSPSRRNVLGGTLSYHNRLQLAVVLDKVVYYHLIFSLDMSENFSVS